LTPASGDKAKLLWFGTPPLPDGAALELA